MMEHDIERDQPIGTYLFKNLYNEIIEEYELDFKYASFMSLLLNRNTWLLIYAWAIAEHFGKNIEDIFYLNKKNKK